MYWRTVLKKAGSFPSPTPLTTVRSKLIQRPMDPSHESGDPDEWYKENHMTEHPPPPPLTPDQPTLSPVELHMQPLNYNQLRKGPWAGLTTDSAFARSESWLLRSRNAGKVNMNIDF